MPIGLAQRKPRSCAGINPQSVHHGEHRVAQRRAKAILLSFVEHGVTKDTETQGLRKPLASSFPRRRDSSLFKGMDSRLRGNDGNVARVKRSGIRGFLDPTAVRPGYGASRQRRRGLRTQEGDRLMPIGLAQRKPRSCAGINPQSVHHGEHRVAQRRAKAIVLSFVEHGVTKDTETQGLRKPRASSFPRRRESSLIKGMDSRLRGNDSNVARMKRSGIRATGFCGFAGLVGYASLTHPASVDPLPAPLALGVERRSNRRPNPPRRGSRSLPDNASRCRRRYRA